MKYHYPSNTAEWQEAVDAAQFAVLIHSAQAYGLITGPTVNLNRCLDLLKMGKSLGYRPKCNDELIKMFIG